MSDDSDPFAWPFPWTQFQEAGEKAVEHQADLMKRFFSPNSMPGGFPQLSAMSQMATFKTRVQSGGRISIPDAEREALDIDDGDIVQTIVIPIKRTSETNE